MLSVFSNNMWLPVSTILLGIAPLLSIAINNFNITQVEKVMLTNDKKARNSVLENIILSLIVGLILLTILWAREEIGGENYQEYIKTMIFIIVLAFIVMTFFQAAMSGYSKLIKISIRFYIKDGDGKWYLFRRINNKQMLLEGEKNNVKFLSISELYEKEIYGELDEKRNSRKIVVREYSMKREVFFYVTGLSLLFFAHFMIFSSDLKPINFLFYCFLLILSVLSLITPIIIRVNQHLYTELK